ncbi:hypothetical protein E4U53_003877 [Claviceps sorghi]|nr:hypothetical protein E4U53_003877 [Claviceps sorghi]
MKFIATTALATALLAGQGLADGGLCSSVGATRAAFQPSNVIETCQRIDHAWDCPRSGSYLSYHDQTLTYASLKGDSEVAYICQNDEMWIISCEAGSSMETYVSAACYPFKRVVSIRKTL